MDLCARYPEGVLGLGNQFCDIIKQCISAASFQVLFNGERMEVFSRSGVLDRGLPLYLFVLFVKRLSHNNNREVDRKDWKSIKLARNGRTSFS